MARHKDITGNRYGKLTAIRRVEDPKKNRNALWLFKCDCGNEKITYVYYLGKDIKSSCGCSTQETNSKKSLTHGVSGTPIYSSWRGMKDRCYDPNNCNYRNYGGRGITVCDVWKDDVKVFYTWAVNNGWKEGLTLDRINTNGNYEPTNCKWSTAKEQAINRRTTRYIEYQGQKKTMEDWATVFGLTRDLIKNRLKRKWPTDQLFIPKCVIPTDRRLLADRDLL